MNMILCCSVTSFQRRRTRSCTRRRGLQHAHFPLRMMEMFLIMTMMLSSWRRKTDLNTATYGGSGGGSTDLFVTAFTTTTTTTTCRSAVVVNHQARSRSRSRRNIPIPHTTTTDNNHQHRFHGIFMGGYDATVMNDRGSIQLYTGTTSSLFCPDTARTIITLLELGLPYDLFEVNPIAGFMPDWYLKTINSQGTIPAIRNPSDNNVVVSGSSTTMNEYLCKYNDDIVETKGTPNTGASLMPSTPEECAKLHLLNTYYDTIVNPLQLTYLLTNRSEDDDASKDAKLQEALESTLDYYEDILSGDDDDDEDSHNGGSFLIGNTFTLADIHAIPFIHRMIVSLQDLKQHQLDEERFPKFLQWYETCLQRPSIQTAFNSYSEREIIDSLTTMRQQAK